MSITAEWLITDCALAAIVIEHRDNSAMIGSRVIPRRRRTVNTILPGEVVASANQKGAEAASGSWRKRLAPENHQTQTMQLQPSKQIERGMVVEKPAEESVDLFIEDQLTSKEHRLRKYLGDLEAQPSQFHHYIRPDSRSDFCVGTEIRRQSDNIRTCRPQFGARAGRPPPALSAMMRQPRRR